MQIYFAIDITTHRFIAKMDDYTIGSVNPVRDGNYYKELVYSGRSRKAKYTLGLKGWLEWAKDHYKISEDYPFDWINIEIVKFEPRFM